MTVFPCRNVWYDKELSWWSAYVYVQFYQLGKLSEATKYMNNTQLLV